MLSTREKESPNPSKGDKDNSRQHFGMPRVTVSVLDYADLDQTWPREAQYLRFKLVMAGCTMQQ